MLVHFYVFCILTLQAHFSLWPSGHDKWKWINACAAFGLVLLCPTVMKCIRSTRGTNKWTSARSSHVELCRCFPVSLCQITAITGWCAVSKEPPHLWRIKGTMFWTSQLEADVLSPATLLYLQSPWHSKSVQSFDLSGVLGGGGWRWWRWPQMS